MKREMHRNSLDVYHSTKHTHPTKKQEILNTLEFMRAATMHKIAEFMRVPVHTISGRFGELRKEGKIIEWRVTEDKCTVWKLNATE